MRNLLKILVALVPSIAAAGELDVEVVPEMAAENPAAIVAIGTVAAIGLDPTSRHPRIVAHFTVEDPITGTIRGEEFTVVWTAPLPKGTDLPQAGERVLLYGNDRWDGYVKPISVSAVEPLDAPAESPDAAFAMAR